MGLQNNRMRMIKSAKIQKESLEDQIAAGRYNPCLEVVLPTPQGDRILKIDAGTQDEVKVFAFDKYTIVVNINRPLNYIGMQIFEGVNEVMSIFYDNQEVLEIFKKKKLTAKKVVRTLFFIILEISDNL